MPLGGGTSRLWSGVGGLPSLWKIFTDCWFKVHPLALGELQGQVAQPDCGRALLEDRREAAWQGKRLPDKVRHYLKRWDTTWKGETLPEKVRHYLRRWDTTWQGERLPEKVRDCLTRWGSNWQDGHILENFMIKTKTNTKTKQKGCPIRWTKFWKLQDQLVPQVMITLCHDNGKDEMTFREVSFLLLSCWVSWT